MNAQKTKKSKPKKYIIIKLINHIAELVTVLILKYDFISLCICSSAPNIGVFSQPAMRDNLVRKELLSKRIKRVKNIIIPAFFTIAVSKLATLVNMRVILKFSNNLSLIIFTSILYLAEYISSIARSFC